MPIIVPSGMLSGERMIRLSDAAKLYWPYLYCGSNGYGRFQVSYSSILSRCFKHFSVKPSKELLAKLLKEYKEKHLLFVYEFQGKTWAAWDSVAKQTWHSREDDASPVPPEPAFQDWKQEYQKSKGIPKDDGWIAEQLTVKPDEELSPVDPLGSSVDQPWSTGNVTSEVSENKRGTDIDVLSPVGQPESTVLTNKHKNINTSITSNINNTNTRTIELETVSSTEQGLPILPSLSALLFPASPVHPSEGSLIGTEGWEELIDEAGKAGMVFDPSPHSDFCQKIWRRINIEEKLEIIQAIKLRRENLEYRDPAYIPTLENFVVKKKYRCGLRPKPMEKPDKLAALRGVANGTVRLGR